MVAISEICTCNVKREGYRICMPVCTVLSNNQIDLGTYVVTPFKIINE